MHESELIAAYHEKPIATLSVIRNALYGIAQDDPYYTPAYSELNQRLRQHYARKEDELNAYTS